MTDMNRGLLLAATVAAAFAPPRIHEPGLGGPIVMPKSKAKAKRRKKNKAARKARRRNHD